MEPDPKRQCTARRRSGDQCRAYAVTGADKCRMHLGRRTADVKAEYAARQLVATYGRKIETTATDALLDEVQWTAGHVSWLRERVQQIRADAADAIDADRGDREADRDNDTLVWGVTKRKTGGDDWGTTEGAEPHAYIKLYQAERAHLVKVCSEAIRCGIEERRVRLAEQQGDMVVAVIRAILGDLDLSPDQNARVSEVVPRHLRMLAG